MATEVPDKHVYVSPEDALKKDMVQKFLKIDCGESSHRTRPTIHKIPDSIKQLFPDDYEPKFISIGPLHHHRFELKQMDHIKWKYLRDLTGRSHKTIQSQTIQLEQFIEAMRQHEQDVRKQYSVDVGMDTGELVEVLVLDGCFLIELFIKRATGPMGPPWADAHWNLPMLRNDLLLLENQIPFSVLIALFNIAFPAGFPCPPSRDEENPTLGILDLVVHYISRGKTKAKDLGKAPGQIHHLLHLNHICQLHNFNTAPLQNLSSHTLFSVSTKIVRGSLVNCLFFFASLILMCKHPRYHFSKRAKAPRAIPSAKNLKEAGIKFKKKFDECLLNISFDEESGNLEIPSIYLNQMSISLFRNLIALEQCCQGVEKYFTAYFSFMDSIIDTSEDVEILARHGIMPATKDVANIFDSLCTGSSLDYEKQYLADLYKRVNTYCDSDLHRWKAALVNNYFHNPWSGASVIAAIILLLLTLGATIATIWQTIYSVKSYQKQF